MFHFLSLFAGCGGSSLGYRLAGGQCLLAVDNDRAAVDTYRMNFPGVPVLETDIRTLTAKEVMRFAGLSKGQLDLLDGSPPCQGFSTSGKRVFGDVRNQLYLEYVRLVDALQPRAIIMENVAGLVTGNMRLIFADCFKKVKGCGYRVKARLLDAQYFGVPQERKRIIILGIREDLNADPVFPKPMKSTSVGQALGLDGLIRNNQQGNKWRSLDRASPTLIAHPPQLLGGIRNDVFKRQCADRPTQRYRSLDLPCVTLLQPPPQLRIGETVRRLTLQECCIIQGFPADWQWGRNAYRLLRNSVPPPFTKTIAEALMASLPPAIKQPR